MTASRRYQDSPSIMGSWPILPVHSPGGFPSILPRSLLFQARILGTVREGSSGYAVQGKSFLLDVDAATYTIAFLGSSNLSLQTVIDQINTAVGDAVAFRDNGFLRLESPTTGEASFIRARTDPTLPPTDVFRLLGLFPGVSSSSGDLASPAMAEPDRQIILPGQLSVAEGESYTADAINRALFQLSVNSDHQYGLLARKSQGRTISTPKTNPGSGFTISDTVYTGKTSSPGPDELENVVAILDEDGNAPVIDVRTSLNPTLTLQFSYDPITDAQRVYCAAAPFTATDDTEEIYVVSTAGSMGALLDIPLKILRVSVDNKTVEVLNVDPATGNRVNIGTIGTPVTVTGSRIQVTQQEVQVTGLWTNSGMSQRVEQWSYAKIALRTTNKVELNNRVISIGAQFSLHNVVPGDIVTLSGHTVVDPYSNNGTYRVLNVIDDETLELVSSDFGPVFLNPTGTLGSLKVDSDPNFYPNPYVSISPTAPAGNYQIVYQQLSTLKEILDDVGAVTQPPSSYRQSNDALIEQTLMAVLGPSVNSFYQYLYNDHRVSLESLDYRFKAEHDEVGKHTLIQPSFIKTTLLPSEDGTGAIKWSMNDSDGNNVFRLMSDGQLVLDDPFWFSGFTQLWPSGAFMSDNAGRSISLSAAGFSQLELYDGNGATAMPVFMSLTTGESNCMVQLTTSKGTANFVANGYNGGAGLYLNGYSNTITPAISRAKFVVSKVGLDQSFEFFSTSDETGVLRLDAPLRPPGGSFNNLTRWVTDSAGVAVGFTGSSDPCYRSAVSARAGSVEVQSSSEWPLWIKGQNSTNTLRNSLLFVRELGAGGIVTNGTILGAVAWGGRHTATTRGAFSMGYDGGSEILCFATENWSASARGSKLEFRTSTNGHDHADLRMTLNDTGISVLGNGVFNYNGGTTSVSIGNTTSVGSSLSIRGTRTGAWGIAEINLGDEEQSGRILMSLRGDQEDGSTNKHIFKMYYYSGTAWNPFLTMAPTSANVDTYSLFLHGGDVEIMQSGSFNAYYPGGRIGTHNFNSDNWELGTYGSGDRNCYLDFHAKDGTDYDLRIIRWPGTNGSADISNVGSGDLNIGTGGHIYLNAGGGSVTIDSTNSGNVGFNGLAPQTDSGLYCNQSVSLYESSANYYIPIRYKPYSVQVYTYFSGHIFEHSGTLTTGVTYRNDACNFMAFKQMGCWGVLPIMDTGHNSLDTGQNAYIDTISLYVHKYGLGYGQPFTAIRMEIWKRHVSDLDGTWGTLVGTAYSTFNNSDYSGGVYFYTDIPYEPGHLYILAVDQCFTDYSGAGGSFANYWFNIGGGSVMMRYSGMYQGNSGF